MLGLGRLGVGILEHEEGGSCLCVHACLNAPMMCVCSDFFLVQVVFQAVYEFYDLVALFGLLQVCIANFIMY